MRGTLGPVAAGEQDDLSLMRAIATRDAGALRALYDRHAGLVFTLALRVLRDRAEAEELLGDVFWELWARGERFDAARGSPRTYLITLARSRAIDRARGRGKVRPLSLETGDAGAEASQASTDSTPADESLSAERRAVVGRALQSLEPQQRQAIECAYYDGLSHTEIAERLKRPLGTVKTHIRQGLIRLRESLRNAYEGAV